MWKFGQSDDDRPRSTASRNDEPDAAPNPWDEGTDIQDVPGQGVQDIHGQGDDGPAGHLADRMRPEPASRRHVTDEDERESRGTSRHPYGDKPPYGPVLGLTASWYGVPAAFYLVWLLTLEGEPRAVLGYHLAASLPWLLIAVAGSLAVAGLLRWMIVGWRPFALSFTAAVIGAGFTTVAHSLAQ